MSSSSKFHFRRDVAFVSGVWILRAHVLLWFCDIFVTEASDLKCVGQTDAVCTVTDSVDNTLNFMIVGDWGGRGRIPYTTEIQLKAAAALDSVANRHEKYPDFFISTGDNFYPKGVTDARDERFESTFEKVYDKKSQQCPWYMVPGNHDYNGNLTAQILYTFVSENQRWRLPSNFYTVRYDMEKVGVSVDFVFIDTIKLCGHVKNDSVDNNIDLHPEIKSSQHGFDWIEEQLNNSRANYSFVVGHYPVFSLGQHGSNKCLKTKLLPLLEQYQVNAYLCGHDHNLQHIDLRNEFSNDTDPLHFVVSGMGAKRDARRRHGEAVAPAQERFFYPQSASAYMQPENELSAKWRKLSRRLFTSTSDKGGFVHCNLSSDVATFTYYSASARRLYNFDVKPRRF